MISQNVSVAISTIIAPNVKTIIILKEENASKILVQVSLDAFSAITSKNATHATLIMDLWSLMLPDSANAIQINGLTQIKISALIVIK
jgi:hypothetical protein